MSNTYFKKHVSESERFEQASDTVTLTAFVGGTKSIQMSLSGGYGYSCIMLSNSEARRLAKALLERTDGKITATGSEESNYTDIDTEI